VIKAEVLPKVEDSRDEAAVAGIIASLIVVHT